MPGGIPGAGKHCGMGVTTDEGEEGFQLLSLCFGEEGTGHRVSSSEKQLLSPCLVASFNGKPVLVANKCLSFVNQLFEVSF